MVVVRGLTVRKPINLTTFCRTHLHNMAIRVITTMNSLCLCVGSLAVLSIRLKNKFISPSSATGRLTRVHIKFQGEFPQVVLYSINHESATLISVMGIRLNAIEICD